MLNGKVYLVSSPGLISAVFRNRDLSFDPYALDFAEGLLQVDRKWVTNVWAQPGWLDGFNSMVHSSLAGDALRWTKERCYRELAVLLNEFACDGTVEVPSVFDWVAGVLSVAFTRTIYEDKNPMTPEALRAIWHVSPLRLTSKPC